MGLDRSGLLELISVSKHVKRQRVFSPSKQILPVTRRLGQEVPLNTNRRGFLAATGAAAAEGLIRAQDTPHDHEHQAVPSDVALRTKALESLLVEKGLVDPVALDASVDAYEHKIG